MVKVTGTVTLDGAPVADANVMFMPVAEGRPANSNKGTDAAGKFTLTTEKLDDGAQEGKYNVIVTGVRRTGVETNPDGTSGDISKMQEVWFVPKKYSQPGNSGLTQTVTKGMPPIELKLSTK